MKIIAKILAVYLLLLALFPCADGGDWYAIDVLESIGIELHSTDHSGEDHNKECGDHCSPLCFCGCCQMALDAPAEATEIKDLNAKISLKPSFTTQFVDLLTVNDIWQPPQLG